MNLLPNARQSDIIVQETGTELLIYNLKTNQAYSLNETSSIVYRACDGKTSLDELKTKHRLTDDLIFLSLDILKKNDLLEDSYQTRFTGVSRRELIREVGLTTMMALPLITSITAPRAAEAQSVAQVACGSECSSSAECPAGCSNCRQFLGRCGFGFNICFNPGGPCTVTGRCEGIGIPGVGFCSVDRSPCTNVNGFCTATLTCQGSGDSTCRAF